MVCPTISGTIVDRLDHVRITRFSRDLFSASTLSIRCPSTNGPFLTDRLMRARASPPHPAARRGPSCLPPVAHDPLGARLRLLPGLVAQRRLPPRADRAGHPDRGLALAPTCVAWGRRPSHRDRPA